MKADNLAKLRKAMEKSLEPKRYEHTLSVSYTAANLAMVHGADIEKALIAGMLHDCAKCLTYEEQREICAKYHMILTDAEQEEGSPLIHAKTGSILAKEKYGVTDTDVLNAIAYHTTGRPKMSQLEKIIYIADYIEPGRVHAKRNGSLTEEYLQNLTIARTLAYQDLDRALCKILHDTLVHLQNKGSQVDPMTARTYEYYRQL